ncbi:MAG: host-nuclease inhibitor Gam family protein [Fimbriimonadaceae bacterium]|nr:host-nuclease inhibitor Gam family protein [Fimbriimonadaceae bacterium]QYK56630.1 MAG: host-nuclease inhibitor Gam family protein [Fimbriimonadaceae bacterium]
MSDLQSALPVDPVLTDDGLWIDPETGEVVGEADGTPAELDEQGVEAALRRILRVRTRLRTAAVAREGAAAQCDDILQRAMDEARQSPEYLEAAALAAQAQRVAEKAAKANDWLTAAYLPMVAADARQRLKGKARSFDYLTGRVSFRTQPERWLVTDEPAACEWLEKNGQAQAVKKAVAKSELAKIKDALAFDDPDGIEYVPPSETVEIKFPEVSQ